jgi:hypothetical protein
LKFDGQNQTEAKIKWSKMYFFLILVGSIGSSQRYNAHRIQNSTFFSFAANSRTALTEHIIEVSSLDTNFKTARVISDEQPHWPLRNCSMSVEHEN